VMTKMPPPITAPMPSAVSPQGPSVRLSAILPLSSLTAVGDLVRSSWLIMRTFFRGCCVRWKQRGRRFVRRPRIDSRLNHRSAGIAGSELAAPVSVERIEDQADERPDHEDKLGGHAEVDEQQQAADDCERADD